MTFPVIHVPKSAGYSLAYYLFVEACVAERLKPAIPDLEARDSSSASRIVSLHKKLYSTLSLFTRVYKLVPPTYCWVGGGRGGEEGGRVILIQTTIPSGGSSNTLRHASCQGNRDNPSRLGLWFLCAFTFSPFFFDYNLFLTFSTPPSV